MEYLIRSYVESDFGALDKFAKAVWAKSTYHEETFALVSKCKTGNLTLALFDGEIIGYIAGFPWNGDMPKLEDLKPSDYTEGQEVWWHIHDVSVSEKHRGMGIGSKLLRNQIEVAKKLGFTLFKGIAVSEEGEALSNKNKEYYNVNSVEEKSADGYLPSAKVRRYEL